MKFGLESAFDTYEKAQVALQDATQTEREAKQELVNECVKNGMVEFLDIRMSRLRRYMRIAKERIPL